MSAQATEKDLARARKILASTPLIDGHNDLPWAIREDTTAPMDVAAYDLRKHTHGHDRSRATEERNGRRPVLVDLRSRRIKDSGYARDPARAVRHRAPRSSRCIPSASSCALTAEDVRDAFKRGKIGSLLGLEGGHAIENSLGALRVLLRPRRAVHDADAQRHARLGRRRARFGEARRAHASSERKSCAR